MNETHDEFLERHAEMKREKSEMRAKREMNEGKGDWFRPRQLKLSYKTDQCSAFYISPGRNMCNS